MATMDDKLEILDITDVDVNQALRSYTAHKQWVTRNLWTSVQLLGLLKDNFAASTIENLQVRLTRCTHQVTYLSQYSDVLVQEKFAKAKDHVDEVNEHRELMAKHWTDYHVIANTAKKENPAQAAAHPCPTSAPKIANDLKPEALQADASASDLRQWKRQFQAFYSASILATCKMANCFPRNTFKQRSSQIHR